MYWPNSNTSSRPWRWMENECDRSPTPACPRNAVSPPARMTQATCRRSLVWEVTPICSSLTTSGNRCGSPGPSGNVRTALSASSIAISSEPSPHLGRQESGCTVQRRVPVDDGRTRSGCRRDGRRPPRDADAGRRSREEEPARLRYMVLCNRGERSHGRDTRTAGGQARPQQRRSLDLLK